MRKLAARAALISVAVLSGCVYTNIKAPLDTDVSETRLGAKVGRSKVHSVLWLVAWGDGSIDAAAKNGGLCTVNHLDVEYFNVLFGAYTNTTTVAYGD